MYALTNKQPTRDVYGFDMGPTLSSELNSNIVPSPNKPATAQQSLTSAHPNDPDYTLVSMGLRDSSGFTPGRFDPTVLKSVLMSHAMQDHMSGSSKSRENSVSPRCSPH